MTRQTLVATSPTLLALLCACGTTPENLGSVDAPDAGAHTTDAGEADGDPDTSGPIPDVGPSPAFAEFDCTYPDLVWTTPRYERWLEPAWVGFSPNNGLAMMTFHGGFGATAWRLADGAVTSGGGNTPLALSDDWSTAAEPGEDSVLDISTGGRTVVAIDPPDLIPGWLTAAVTADGQRVAVSSCTETTHFVAVVDLESPAEVSWFEYPVVGNECSVYPRRPLLTFEPDGAGLIFSPATGARLARIDATTGATSWIEAHAAGEPIDGMPAEADVFAVAVHPAGTEIATTGSDLVMRRWSLPGLEAIGEPIPVGAEVLNEMTYAPWWTASPVAYSPGGTFIAYIEPSLDAVVRRLDDQSLVATVAREQLPVPADDFPTDDNAFAWLVFTPDGQDLLLVNQHGAALFGCTHTLPEVELDGALEVEGPSAARVTGTANYTIVLPEEFDEQAVVRVSLDGGETFGDLRDLTFSWYLDTARLYTFEFVATDGIREARATRTLDLR